MSVISASTNFEVNGSSGSDTNGGGFDATILGGTDYTQGAGVKTIVFDGATIFFTAAGAAATVTLVGYTVLATDVGNVIQTVTSTGVLVGFFTITSVSTGSNTWTFGGNITSGVVAGGKGTAGGALASPGGAPNSSLSTGNIVFIKGNQTYSMVTTAGSGGRISSAGGNVCGYNTTRALFNADSNLPVVQSSGSNTFTLISVGNSCVYSSLVFANGNANTGITAVSDQGNNGAHYFNLVGTGVSALLNINSNGGRADYCAAINCTANTPIESTGGTGTIFNYCVVSGFGGIGGGTSYARNCVVASSGSATISADFNAFIECVDCISYNHTHAGIPGFAATTRLHNCIIHSAIGSGVVGVAPASNIVAAIINCAFYNNTTDVGTLGKCSLVGKISLSADPFVNAAGGNFQLNNTAGGGALLRALGWPGSLPGIPTSNYLDVGAAQHQDSPAQAVMLSRTRRKVR